MNSIRLVWKTALVALAITVAPFFLASFPSVQQINLKGRDLFFKLQHALFERPEASKQIVLVNLDDESLQRIQDRWPYPRNYYARILENLKSLAPKAVGFDLVFSGADFTPESDQVFAKALTDIGNVVIAAHEGRESEVYPLRLLAQSAWKVGVVNKVRDRDRIIRRSFLSYIKDNGEQPSWEKALYEKAISAKDAEQFPRAKPVSINYRLGFREFPNISFWKLFEGKTEKKDIENKIVLIGLTSEAFHDIHATPLGSMPGLAVNANLLLMLINKSFFTYVPIGIHAALVFLSVWLVLLVSISASVVTGISVLISLAIAFLGTSFLLFANQVILDFWFVLVGLILTLSGAVAFREWQLFLENLRLREESARDPLTGFYSRRFLELKLKSEFGHLMLKRSGAHAVRDVSVVMLDLDNFKLVNDTFGHAEGDRVLRTMATAIRSSVRKEELICRFGGDEFCVILVNTKIEDAARFAEKLRILIAQNPDLAYRTAGGVDTIRVTGSIGVASVTGAKATDSDKLMKAADRALYRAKAGGRNQVCIFDPKRDVIE
jgi:diguanylate cyclase (GGDEF)-like protein